MHSPKQLGRLVTEAVQGRYLCHGMVIDPRNRALGDGWSGEELDGRSFMVASFVHRGVPGAGAAALPVRHELAAGPVGGMGNAWPG